MTELKKGQVGLHLDRNGEGGEPWTASIVVNIGYHMPMATSFGATLMETKEESD